MNSSKNYSPLIMLLSVSLFFFACDTQSKEGANAKNAKTEDQASLPNSAKGQKLQTWVDKLNLRATPSLDAKTIAKVTPEMILDFTGKKSAESSTIVLRGVLYEDPWLEVQTPDQQTGWVFGGAVTTSGVAKGNAPISDLKFDFPKFGAFDLTTWQKTKRDDSEAGDAESYTAIYEKANRKLKIVLTEVGEYGYHRHYQLMEANGKVLKERKFSFDADSEAHRLTETVKDYTQQPAKQYQRTQETKMHFMQLNTKPVMAQGAWETTTLDLEAEAKIADAYVFQVFSGGANLPETFDTDDGCVCFFRTHLEDYNTVIFRSTMLEVPKAQAIIRVDDKFAVLQSIETKNPDYKRGDYFADYQNDQYELSIVAFEEGTNDGGGKIYAGTMKLSFKKDGTILAHINAFGSCGC